jgi:hypothetical protein
LTNFTLLNIRVLGSTYEGQEKRVENESDLMETLGVVKEEVSDIWCEGVDWIDLAQDRVQRKDSENTAMNLLLP